MIKKIPVDQLRLGMHVHEFCGSWLNHPFWRSKFTLQRQEDLQQIVDGGVGDVWIDTDKGVDVAVHAAQIEVNLPTDGSAQRAASVSQEPQKAQSAVHAAAQAAAIVRRSVPKIAALFAEARLGGVVRTADFQAMVEEISVSVISNPGALISVARLKQRDTYTYMHSVAVCALMVALGRQLGLSVDALKVAGLAGMLHDLGKVAIPLDILNKPGKLTAVEFDLVKTHAERGHQLLVHGGAPADVLDVCLHHHEKIDGSGYPKGLAGAEISLLAKMAAVCDVYDAVTSERPYKSGWDPAEALRSMATWTGHFEPRIFQAFVKTVGIYPVGSMVRLSSGRLAVVTVQNPQSLLAPKVKVFFSTKSDLRLDPYEVDLASKNCREKLVCCESPDDWNFKDLDQLTCSA